MADLRSIDGRVALVTGAGGGIGCATARLLAAEGARIAAVDHDAGALAALADSSSDDRIVTWSLDVSDTEAVKRVVGEARARMGQIDIVVNNAGVSAPAPITAPEDDYEAAWAISLAVNLGGAATVLRACVADLTRDGDGRVVNVASTEGLGATAYLSPYTAAKHGLVGLTRSLAVELGPTGVTVNCICPGPVNTPMTAGIPDDAKAKFARRRVPARRYGDPSEIAHMILSLVLPAASYVNGAVIPVDGGLMAQNT